MAIVLLMLAAVLVIGGIEFYLHATQSAPAQPAGGTGLSTPIASSTPTSTLPTPSSTPSSTAQNPGKKPALSPASGPVGTVVTINGSGFAGTDNMVTLGGLTDASLKSLPSADGKTIQFTLPSTLGPNCKPDQACPQYLALVTAGEHFDVVVISSGASTDIGEFTVTAQ